MLDTVVTIVGIIVTIADICVGIYAIYIATKK